jgi:peptidase M28-like protein
MTKPLAIFFGFFLLAISATAQDETLKTLLNRVSESSLQTNLQKIAGPGMDGRMAASKGDELAIQYIAAWFNTHHLAHPYTTSTPYMQSVPLLKVDFQNSTLSVGDKPYGLYKDWTYFMVDKAGTATNTEVVFIGYGLSVPAYDDLRDVDITGKLVLFRSGVPTDSAGKPLFATGQIPNLSTQLTAVRSLNPLGMLMYIEDPIAENANSLKEIKALYPYHQFGTPGFPLLTGAIISKDLATTILGSSVDSIYDLINRSGKPHSFNTHKQVSLSIIETDDHRESSNVIGIIPGTDTSLGAIVITAHHDHLGTFDGKTYYGADDNGTGTVAILEMTKILGDAAAKGIRPKRTLVFVSTAAEEQGLIGSTWYVSHPVLPLAKTSYHINIDMFGRVDSFYSGKRPDSNYVYTIYKGFSGEKIKGINEACCQLLLDTLYNKKITPTSNGLMARADDLPFIKANIPSLWFFGGYHPDYHEPTDTPDKIDYTLLKRRTQLALATLWNLANE